MHVSDRQQVITSINSLETELNSRLDISTILLQSIKNLSLEEKFVTLSTIYERFHESAQIIARNIRMKVADVMMEAINTDSLPISANISVDYLTEMYKQNKITLLQLISYANFQLYEEDQRLLFDKHYNDLKPYKKGIHIFVLKEK